jgi:hypothetical protein
MLFRSWFGAGAASVLVLVALVAESQSQPRPLARAAKACSVPAYPGDGYFTSLRVRKVSCRTGRRLAVAYYHCRTKNGPAGKCRRARVMRYRCHEVRQSIPTELDGRVTCKRGARRVVHTYQQNL